MRVEFCGVRGSTPAPGPAFVRVGGHTSCVAIAHDGEAPSLLLDGGTGLRQVTALLQGQAFQGSLLLSHLHWDHVHGLPFFTSGAAEGARVDVQLPSPDGDPVATLERGMSPPHFPVGPMDLGPGWTYRSLCEGEQQLEGFTVLARVIPHKGGQTFGFRVSDGTSSMAYLSDHMPLALGDGPGGYGALHDAAMALADGVDLLVHDAQYVAAEFPRVAHLGHASVEYCVSLARSAGARRLALFHHAQDRTDDDVEQMTADARCDEVDVLTATQELVVNLPD